MRFRILLTICVLILGSAIHAAPADNLDAGTQSTAILSGIETELSAKQLKIRLLLDREREATSNYLPARMDGVANPRFFMDIDGARMDSQLAAKGFPKEALVQRIRFGQRTGTTLRVVLDLASQVQPEDIRVVSVGNALEIQVGNKEDDENIAAMQPTAPASPAVVQEPPSTETTEVASAGPDVVAAVISGNGVERRVIKERMSAARKRIVLDAGHGGEDQGARGKGGTLEKDICLQITRRVAQKLRNKAKYEVFMTRESDIYIPLAERTRLANHYQGDVFVSIHANASPKRSASGVSTYILNNADDEESLRVAMRENAELQAPKELPENANPDEYYLQIMKSSMVKNFHTTQSTDLAQGVQVALLRDLGKKYSGVVDLGVRSANFFVLAGAEMPAILIETSFISNPMEERRLRSSDYQNRVSDAIVMGIERFLERPMTEASHTALYGIKR